MNRNLFWTSDTHYYHANAIVHNRRPFKDVPEMNSEMVRRWNDKVPPDATVFFLGDFAFASVEQIVEVLNSLNGRIIVVSGNHDKKMYHSDVLNLDKVVKVTPYYEYQVDDADAPYGKQHIVMSHYPFLTWNRAHYGSWMLHGHSHGNAQYPYAARIMDVGVDPNGYVPLSYDDVKARMSKIEPKRSFDPSLGGIL